MNERSSGIAQSLFASRGEKRAPQPFGLGLARSGHSRGHFFRFLRAQADGKNHPESIFFVQPGAAHFLSHIKIVLVYKNLLTRSYFPFTTSPVSNSETESFQQSARTSLERLVTKDTRREPGRANKRLAMNAHAHQEATSGRPSRSLKIEATGDFYRKKVIPRIRLNGKWLEQAGFKPGHRAEICVEQPGIMTLRFVKQSEETL